jgi:hypothetical protein
MGKLNIRSRRTAVDDQPEQESLVVSIGHISLTFFIYHLAAEMFLYYEILTTES